MAPGEVRTDRQPQVPDYLSRLDGTIDSLESLLKELANRLKPVTSEPAPPPGGGVTSRGGAPPGEPPGLGLVGLVQRIQVQVARVEKVNVALAELLRYLEI